MIASLVIGVTVLAVAVGLLVGGWRLSYRPDLARILTDGDQMVVRPIGLARILAFRRDLRLDTAAIQRVTAIDRDAMPDLRVRLLGTGMPGLKAGMFTGDDGRCFVLAGRAGRFLRIDTGAGPVRYTVVQVRNPDLLATTLGGGS